MTIGEFLPLLEEMAPLAYAEDFDNVGLIVGDKTRELKGVLVCHDALENVIAEAIDEDCNLVVCFHPILFSGIKKITGNDYVQRAVVSAIRHDIAIYAVHTALDNHNNGVNRIFCDALGIRNPKILVPKKNFIQKLVTYTIPENTEKVREALFSAGAGQIGNYDRCSFNSDGTGTYRGNEDSDPAIGQKGEWQQSDEVKIEVTFEKFRQSAVLKALFEAHVYEEVAYEIYELGNYHQEIGLGMIGDLEPARSERDFLQLVRDRMQADGIRHSVLLDKPIRRVAVLGGSGSFAIGDAIRAGADAFVTADLKYHQFYEAEGKLLLLDIGHYESERFTKNHMHDFLSKKIATFAPAFSTGRIVLSKENTNPVKYF